MPLTGNITLTFISGPEIGTSLEFRPHRTIVIGKDTDCEVVTKGRGVSRKHCRLESKDNGWVLLDLSSTNGTQVNGRWIGGPMLKTPATAVVLNSGDLVQIGEVDFKFVIDGGSIERTEIFHPQDRISRDSTEIMEPKSQSQTQSAKHPMKREKTLVVGTGSERQKAPGGDRENPNAMRTSATPLAPLPVNEVPKEFRHYQTVQKIGAGGMGDVWLVHEKGQTDRQWAIKFLRAQGDKNELDRSRFMREMAITMSLQHSSVIRCVDCGEERGQLFIVMEYCNGGNLSQLLLRSGRLVERRAIRLLDRLLSGVEHAHARGIVHRDLKPSNILLHQGAGGKYTPKISDFGLAKNYLIAGDSGMTVNGSVGGSWCYMPKEQLTNFRFVAPQSDVWSMGAIFFESLSLALPRPFVKGADPIRTILESEILSLKSVMPHAAPELIQFVDRCLHPDPDRRFTDAGEMRKALAVVAEQMGLKP